MSTPDESVRPTFEDATLASVRVSVLNVRTDPGTSAPVLDDGGKVRLSLGEHLLVVSEPAWADGMWWLQIATDRGGGAIGWVPVGPQTDPWLEADRAWCPDSDPSLATLVALTRIERRGCYGATSITFDAFRATIPPDAGLGGACEPPPTYPSWLVCDNINYSYVNRDGGYDWEFLLHFDPALGIAETGLATEGEPNPLLRITGHFADPAAEQCAPRRATTADEAGGWGARWLDCTTLFVVEQIN